MSGRFLAYPLLLPLLAAGCGDDAPAEPDAAVSTEVTTDHCEYAPTPTNANTGGTVEAGTLQAGAAEALLDVPVGTSLGAYTARAGFLGNAGTVDLRKVAISGAFNASIGIESQARVRAVALAAGGETVLLLKVDIGFVYEGMIFDLEERLGSEYAGKILISASHSHSGWGQYSAHSALMVGSGVFRRTVYDRILDGFETAARDALAALRPAKIGFFADTDFDPDNAITNDRRSANDDLPGGDRKDTSFFLIRVDGTDDAPIAAIPVYGVHGTLLDAENGMMSGDAPGGMELLMEEAFDEQVVIMHLQGAGGDVSPTGYGTLDCDRRPNDDDDPCFLWLEKEGHGRQALPTMLAAYQAAGENMQTELAIEMVTRSIELGPDFETFSIRDGALTYAPFDREREADREIWAGDGQLLSPIDEFNAPVGAALCENENALFPAGEMPGTGGIDPYGGCVRIDTASEILGQLLKIPFESGPTRPVCQTTRTTVSALRLGDYLLATLPGEPTVPLVDKLRAASPADPDKTIFVGYAQGHVGYLLTPEDWLAGGYEPSVTFWGPLEGEYIGERVLELMPLALTDSREDAAAGGVDRIVTPALDDNLPVDDPAPMAGTVPAEVPERVWVRSGVPAQAQPAATVERVAGLATFVWIGDDPLVKTPDIRLERETAPDTWETVTRRSGRVVRDHSLLLEYTPLPVRREDDQPQTHYWAIEWQPVPWIGADAAIDGLDGRAGVPLGRYRFAVVGKDFELTSDPFEVVPAPLLVTWESVVSNVVTARVQLEAPKGYRLLDLSRPSNRPVPVGDATVTVELLDDRGIALQDPIEATTDAFGKLRFDAGDGVTDAKSLRVTDGFGNVGTGAL